VKTIEDYYVLRAYGHLTRADRRRLFAASLYTGVDGIDTLCDSCGDAGELASITMMGMALQDPEKAVSVAIIAALFKALDAASEGGAPGPVETLIKLVDPDRDDWNNEDLSPASRARKEWKRDVRLANGAQLIESYLEAVTALGKLLADLVTANAPGTSTILGDGSASDDKRAQLLVDLIKSGVA